jgi:hypothetical protein
MNLLSEQDRWETKIFLIYTLSLTTKKASNETDKSLFCKTLKHRRKLPFLFTNLFCTLQLIFFEISLTFISPKRKNIEWNWQVIILQNIETQTFKYTLFILSLDITLC